MISITGLEFAYTQAPISLKSVLTSFWLLTVSVGNIVVIIIAEGRIMPTQVAEYLFFAALILLADMAFILLAVFYYDYVEVGEFDDFTYPREIAEPMGLKVIEDGESSQGQVNLGLIAENKM